LLPFPLSSSMLETLQSKAQVHFSSFNHRFIPHSHHFMVASEQTTSEPSVHLEGYQTRKTNSLPSLQKALSALRAFRFLSTIKDSHDLFHSAEREQKSWLGLETPNFASSFKLIYTQPWESESECVRVRAYRYKDPFFFRPFCDNFETLFIFSALQLKFSLLRGVESKPKAVL
jgi:hypothetical protein